MQKSKKHHPAEKANAGKTGKTGKTRNRKPMTPEQRLRKNQKDRERRARLREAADKANCRKAAGKPGKKTPVRKCFAARDCGDCSRNGLASPESVISKIVDIVRREVGGDTATSAGSGEPVTLENGVVRGSVVLPNGCHMVVTFVDCDSADPLSPYSPIPQAVRRILLRVRMAAEIAGLVDSRMEAVR